MFLTPPPETSRGGGGGRVTAAQRPLVQGHRGVRTKKGQDKNKSSCP